MKKTVWTFALCFALTAATSATAKPSADPVTATLAPAPNASTSTPQSEPFFRPATLTLDNTTPHTVRAVLLQPGGGGPAIFWPCVVPPGTLQTVTVPLPPFSAAQPYAVNLLAKDSPHATPIAVAEATIEWPAELVRREFLTADYTPAYWPIDVKRNVVLLLTLGLLTLAATLLIRRPVWRIAAAIAVTTTVTVTTLVWLSAQPHVYEQQLPAVPGAGGEIIAVSALRSTQWSTDRPLVPVYQTMAEFRADPSIVHPGQSITLPLRAGQTRLFIQSTP
jgi:hypothetical protein